MYCCVCESIQASTLYTPNRNTQYRMHISVLKVVEKGSCLGLTSIDKLCLCCAVPSMNFTAGSRLTIQSLCAD